MRRDSRLPSSRDPYVLWYPRLCALLTAAKPDLTVARAGLLLREHVRRRQEPDYTPLPALVRSIRDRHAYTGRRYHTALGTLLRTPAPAYEAPPVAAPASAGMMLTLTSDGFLNLEQACEFRLRYEDVTASDRVDGIDVLLANGTSRLITHDDPGFEPLIEAIEEQGYVICTQRS